MIAVPLEPRRWPHRRWWSAVVLVLVLQAVLIFSLEDRSRPGPRRADSAPQILLSANASGDQLALYNPSLFALPQREGFSGEGWLKGIPAPEFRPDSWSESPRWLKLSVDDLVADFEDFLRVSWPAPFPTLVVTEPDPDAPALFPTSPVSTASTLRIEGELAGRRLLSRPELPIWTNTDVLTNTIVQVLVDEQGATFSAVLLLRSGLTEADAYALETARSARFNTVAPTGPAQGETPVPALTPGRMIFQWQTRFAPSTNASPVVP